jgi:predicted RNA-binding Zn-ribbon protein involved in translation (DUF1610 family)
MDAQERIRAEHQERRIAESAAHLARIARSGLTPAEYARRATADAWSIHDGMLAAEARAEAQAGDDAPRNGAGRLHLRFGWEESREARGWDADRWEAAMRRARGLRLVMWWHSTPGQFVRDGLNAAPCPECGKPTIARQRGHDAATPGRCGVCDHGPDPEGDRAALLALIGASWTAYLTRPSYKRAKRGGWQHDDGGSYPYMRGNEDHAWTPGERRLFAPERDDHQPEYAGRHSRTAARRAVAQLVRDGLVAILAGGITPGPGGGWGRSCYALTPAGFDALGIDAASFPPPADGIRLMSHRPGDHATTVAPGGFDLFTDAIDHAGDPPRATPAPAPVPTTHAIHTPTPLTLF